MEKAIKNRFEKLEKRVSKIEGYIEKGLTGDGKLVQCHLCNYSWKSRSKAKLVSCPSCSQKTYTNKTDKILGKMSNVGKKIKSKYDYLDPIMND